jgi:hypothetical protein
MTKEPKDYTHDEVVYTCMAMSRYGGSFAGHIANAAMVADRGNLHILLTSLSHLFVKYGPGSDFYSGPQV